MRMMKRRPTEDTVPYYRDSVWATKAEAQMRYKKLKSYKTDSRVTYSVRVVKDTDAYGNTAWAVYKARY